jgi:hypothetical protein
MIATIASSAALYLHLRSKEQLIGFRAPIVACVFTLILAPAIVLCVLGLKGLATILTVMPVEHNPGYARIVATFLQPLFIIVLVLGWKLADHWQLHRPLAVAASITMSLLAFFFWDDRGPYERELDRAERQATLAEMIPDRHGEILWLTSSTETWFWLGRANWLTGVQGAGIVFSRPLAMFFGERAKFLRELDLADADVLEPWSQAVAVRYPTLTADRLARVCQRPDAPIAIIAPIEEGNGQLPGLKASIWTAPVAKFHDVIEGESVAFQRLKAFAVFDCADYATNSPS